MNGAWGSFGHGFTVERFRFAVRVTLFSRDYKYVNVWKNILWWYSSTCRVWEETSRIDERLLSSRTAAHESRVGVRLQ